MGDLYGVVSLSCSLVEVCFVLCIRGFIIPNRNAEKERGKRKETSHAGNRTRIGRVRACYPNQLDYMGPVFAFNLAHLTDGYNKHAQEKRENYHSATNSTLRINDPLHLYHPPP